MQVKQHNILRNFKNTMFYVDCFLYWVDLMLSPIQKKNILVLLAKHDSGELRCPATAHIGTGTGTCGIGKNSSAFP